MLVNLDLVVNEQNLAIFANIERRATGDLALSFIDSIGLGRDSVRIAENGIVGFQAFGKFFVLFWWIDARGKIRDIEFFERFAVIT